jgi:osmotically-inducible protein OsmY
VATDPNRDQSETSADAESIREIRALLAADKALSPTARQVNIVAANGRVRLTGQVNTAEERAAVERAARKAANVIDVRNQLVVLQ